MWVDATMMMIMMKRQEKGLKLFPRIFEEIVWYFTLSKSEMKSLIYIVGVVCDKWLLELTQEDNSCLRKNSFYGIYFYNLKKKLWGI